ncbi:hypothetical protein [Pararhizobium sp. LjRoot238]|uniref:hypothetical protein n=1 Tax=Pararhizobium sp. LjRoot238 TaxID=3342293 RepID=UPI003ECD0EA5
MDEKYEDEQFDAYRLEILAQLATLHRTSPRREVLEAALSVYDPEIRARRKASWAAYQQRAWQRRQDDRLLLTSATLAFFSLSVSALGLLFPGTLAEKITAYVPNFHLFEFLFSYSPYFITIGGLIAAALLFAIRGYFPKTYGFLEIWVGVATLTNAALAVSLGNIPSVLQYLAGVYVIIRGLDNFAKALESKTKIGMIFKRLFNNPK